MPVWSDSNMESFDHTGSETEDCEVRIDGHEIVVTYRHAGLGYVTYRGSEVGPGHYKLECQALNGKATLHQLPGSEYLDGYWTEQGASGMWRVMLANNRDE